ncbi:MAG: DUF938 domain-containing protein [Methylovirgula sp.]|nr:DUF938 domain-containing protein [Methylovirgula sp.]
MDPHPLSPYVAWAGNRNKEPILSVLKGLLPEQGDVLELASGAGLHINYFAPHFPEIIFHPSDKDVSVFDTIKSKRGAAGNKNVADPVALDLTDSSTWPDAENGLFDAIFVINIFQVAPVSIAEGIAALGAKVLKPNGFVAIYGPFKLNGKYTTQSNADFDGELRAAGVSEWHLKDIADLEKAANKHGLISKTRFDLPANNFILQFVRA